MYRVWICEKKTLAEHLLEALPKPHTKDRYSYTADGGKEVIVYTSGHILEAFMPNDYDEKYKSWKMSDLPILPPAWKMKVNATKSAMFKEIASHIKKATEIVNVGDPDREGQFLVDEVLVYLKTKCPVKRVFIPQYQIDSTKKAIKDMTDNKLYENTYLAGLARQQFDWITGINLSRCYSMKAKEYGFQGVLPIGRVKTPTVAIVVKRDEDIENFVSKEFYEIFVDLEHNGQKFTARWKPSEISEELIAVKERFLNGEELNDEELALLEKNDHSDWLDENYRITKKEKAEEIAQKIATANQITVSKYTKKETKEYQPLGFTLALLQKEVNRRTKLPAKEIEVLCQSFYEKGYMTYPRSEYQHLKMDLQKDIEKTMFAISSIPELKDFVEKADLTIKSKIWDDSKVEAHHAIIPTVTKPLYGKLTQAEKDLYYVLAKRYLEQFYPPARYDDAVLEIDAGGEKLLARGRVTLEEGWKIIGKDTEKEKPKKEETLPVLKEGNVLKLINTETKSRKTNPPEPFGLVDLQIAMSKVHTLVSDPKEIKKLKELSGIGTEATRGPTIQELLAKGLLKVEKRGGIEYVRSTPLGKGIVKSVPSEITDAGLTARWETMLSAINKGKLSFSDFDKEQKEFINRLLKMDVNFQLLSNVDSNVKTKTVKKEVEKTGDKCPQCNHDLIKRKSQHGEFVGCSNYPTCKYIVPTKKAETGKKLDKSCPVCKKGHLLEKVVVKEGANKGRKYIGCSDFPNCKHFEWLDI